MRSLISIARLTGLGYLAIFISGFFANFYTLEGMVVDNNPQLTLENISTQIGLFQLGVASFSLMIIVDILLAFPLYKLLKSVHRNWALSSSLIRFINGLIFLLALVNLFEIASIAQSGTARPAAVIDLLETFNMIWNVGLLFFGAHLIMLGWLMVKSLNFPDFIGLLLQIAGLTYLADSGAQLFWAPYQEYKPLFEILVIGGGVIGEFSLTLWLLIKGVRRENKGALS
tara:strand:- start:3032 stop:3715 length:684 start_codon:yes stop_codon:yes gene_type:complete